MGVDLVQFHDCIVAAGRALKHRLGELRGARAAQREAQQVLFRLAPPVLFLREFGLGLERRAAGA